MFSFIQICIFCSIYKDAMYFFLELLWQCLLIAIAKYQRTPSSTSFILKVDIIILFIVSIYSIYRDGLTSKQCLKQSQKLSKMWRVEWGKCSIFFTFLCWKDIKKLRLLLRELHRDHDLYYKLAPAHLIRLAICVIDCKMLNRLQYLLSSLFFVVGRKC